MIFKNAARVMALAAFLFASPAQATNQTVLGTFMDECGPGPDTRSYVISLADHIKIKFERPHSNSQKPKYLTKTLLPKQKNETLYLDECDEEMKNCSPLVGTFVLQRFENEIITGTLEYSDPAVAKKRGKEFFTQKMHIEAQISTLRKNREAKTHLIIICD